MRSIWINKNYIAKIASTVTGGIYAFLGFIGMLVPLDEILSDKMSIWVRSIISISVLTGIWCCCFIIVSVILMNKNDSKFFLQTMDTHYICNTETSLTQTK